MRQIIVVLFVLLMQSEVAVGSQPAYTIIDLGTLGGSASSASSINNAGQVVGGATGPDDAYSHPFLWSASTGMVDMTLLPNPIPSGYGALVDINDFGQGVGSYTVYGEGGGSRAFLWSSGTGVVELGTLGGRHSIPSAINNSSQVVGNSAGADGLTYPFLWSSSGGIANLAPTEGSWGSMHASDINDTGQVVGTLGLWTAESGWTSLGFEAKAINNAGQVVGWVYINRSPYPVLWSASAGITQLSSLSGYAHAVNNLGQVVGQLWDGHRTRAFLWTPESGVTLLDPLGEGGWWYAYAYSINDAGQIVGESNRHAILWEPIPEPSSLLALGFAASGLGGVALRRRRR